MTLSQVTNCIKPNDFKPNGIKPSDYLPFPRVRKKILITTSPKINFNSHESENKPYLICFKVSTFILFLKF